MSQEVIHVNVISKDIDIKFRRMLKKLRGNNEFFREASMDIHRDVMDHFEKEQGPDGRWTPLAKSTLMREFGGKSSKDLAELAQSGVGRKILQKTGRHLKSRITPFYDKDSGGTGVNLLWASAHQFGEPSRNLPARPFFWLSDKAMRMLERKMETSLTRSLDGG